MWFPFELELKVSLHSRGSEMTGFDSVLTPSPANDDGRADERFSSQVHAVEFSKTGAAKTRSAARKSLRLAPEASGVRRLQVVSD